MQSHFNNQGRDRDGQGHPVICLGIAAPSREFFGRISRLQLNACRRNRKDDLGRRKEFGSDDGTSHKQINQGSINQLWRCHDLSMKFEYKNIFPARGRTQNRTFCNMRRNRLASLNFDLMFRQTLQGGKIPAHVRT